MPFPQSGTLTTDKRTVNDSTQWETSQDWDNNQSSTNIDIQNGVIKLLEDQTTLLEGFEDGSATDWTNDAANSINVVQITDSGTQAFSGTYMGEWSDPNPTNSVNYLSFSAIQPTLFEFTVLTENHTSEFDDFQFRIFDGSNELSIASIGVGVGEDITVNSQSTGISSSNGTFYTFSFEAIDYSTNNIGSVFINGSEVITDLAFNNTASEIDKIEVALTGDTDSSFAYLDSVRHNG